MRSVAAVLVSLAVLLAAAPASAAIIVYTTTHSGANENPPNSSAGTGTGTVTVDTTAQTLRYQATWSGLTSNTIDLHLHCCAAPDANSGVAIGFGGFLPATPANSGSVDQTVDLTMAGVYNAAFLAANGGTASGAMMALLMGLANGLGYQNIHSVELPGGELRGNLAELANPIPLPAAAWLFLAGAGALSLRRRKIAAA
jgi:hypothetical protein